MPDGRGGIEKRHHSSHWGAFRAHVRDGRMVGFEPFAKDPAPSPILESIQDAIYDETRISQPMIRAGWLEGGPGKNSEGRGGEPFVPVSWETALGLVAGEIERIKTEHGNESIFAGSYGWASAGRFHHANTLLKRFLNCYGGFTDQVTTYSIAAGYVILPHVLGDNVACSGHITTWDSIAQDAGLFVMFGGVPVKNAQVAAGGAGEHSLEIWLERAKANGVEFVNVSPLEDDAPGFLDAQWLAVRPNTDVALMLGLAHTLWEENLHDKDFLARYCVGFEKFEAYLAGDTDGRPRNADWAAPITGIGADVIRNLARRMAGARTMLNTNWSLQRGDHGEQPFWMTITLAAMLGQIGLPGGGFGFGYGSMGGRGEPRENIPSVRMSFGKNPTGSFIPVARIADMMLHPGEEYDFNGERRTYPDIRMVYWCGGNPFHHHQDLNRLVKAWRRPETIVVHDPWWTSTARHADIVLPATTTLERNDIGSSSRDRFILAMHKVIEPVGDARHDFDIFSELAERLGFRSAFTEDRDETEWLRHIYEEARQKAAAQGVVLDTFEHFWETGHTEVAPPETPHVYLADFRKDPASNPLKTPSGKIEIYSERIESFGYADCPPHPAWLEPLEWLGSGLAEKFPLHLISNQPRTRLHGQMDSGSTSTKSKIQGREPVWIHPEDAAAREIRDGDVVRIFNERGAILAGAVLSQGLLPGVIQLSTGAWYDPQEPGKIGALDKHGNPNVLTPDKGTSSLGQGPSAHSALVEMERYEEELPEITAFQPPSFIEA